MQKVAVGGVFPVWYDEIKTGANGQIYLRRNPMFKIFKGFNLQFFAEGVSGEEVEVDSTGVNEPAAAGQEETGVTTAAAEQTTGKMRTLEGLGVPKDKAERYRARKAKTAPPVVTTAVEEKKVDAPQAAAAPKAEEKAPTWDELMKKPEYKRKMSEIVTNRVKAMQGTLDAVAPMMELLGRRAGMDMSDLSKVDYAALNKAVVDDDIFYEAGANESGEDIQTHKRNMQREMDYNSRMRSLNSREQDFKATLEQIAARNYQERLNADAAELKKEFPDFDLEKEMGNPRFKAMVSPGGGFTLADAYHAIHYKEIKEAIKNSTAHQVQQAMSRSLQSGRTMPVENGSRSKASVPMGNKLYSQMTAEERRAYKAELQRRSK
jgi:hypothetical protein